MDFQLIKLTEIVNILKLSNLFQNLDSEKYLKSFNSFERVLKKC